MIFAYLLGKKHVFISESKVADLFEAFRAVAIFQVVRAAISWGDGTEKQKLQFPEVAAGGWDDDPMEAVEVVAVLEQEMNGHDDKRSTLW